MILYLFIAWLLASPLAALLLGLWIKFAERQKRSDGAHLLPKRGSRLA